MDVVDDGMLRLEDTGMLLGVGTAVPEHDVGNVVFSAT